jgi:hypothetical protein
MSAQGRDGLTLAAIFGAGGAKDALRTERLSALIDALNAAVNESGVGAADAPAVLLNLGLAKAICGKKPGCTWGGLRDFLLKKVAGNYEAMVRIMEAGRAAA